LVGLITAMLLPALSCRADYELTDPELVVTGESPASLAGMSTALVDIDDDGEADLVVGAPLDSTNGPLSGMVLIYLGGDFTSTPDVMIGGASGEKFGTSVANAGDLNGDDVDDLIVGAPLSDDAGLDAGTAYIFFGSDDATDLPSDAADADVILVGTEEGGWLGHSVAAAGDVDQDGYDDVIVGAPMAGAGQVHFFYGGTSMDAVADKTFTGTTPGEQFGYAVAGGMNLDGTNQLDAAVGAPGDDDVKGQVRVILNVARTSPKVVTLNSDVVGDWYGSSLAFADFNGDGYGDVFVGAPYPGGVGKVYAYYGSSQAGRLDNSADLEFSEGLAGDMFGICLAAGDVRTDDIGDIVVGAPMNDSAGVDAGRAYVFHGDAVPDTEPDNVTQGAAAGSWFGRSVASGSVAGADYDDDGDADYAVGSPGHGSYRGAAYLFLGYELILPDNPTVYGYILDATTGEGLSNALVQIESPSQSQSVRTTTNGSYGISSTISVPPGTYWINASIDNYMDGTGQCTLEYETRTNVSYDLDLKPVVSGRIDDGNTSGPDPLEDALVEVLSGDTVLDSLTTDDTGGYSFMLEEEGEVIIRVSKDDYFTDDDTTVTAEKNEEIVTNILLNHMPILIVIVTDSESSDPIADADVEVSIDGDVVGSGTTGDDGRILMVIDETGSADVEVSKTGYLTGTDTEELSENTMTELPIALDRMPTILGIVIDALMGTPVKLATVDLFDGSTDDLLSTTLTDSKGRYSFEEVEIGTYSLMVTAVGYLREWRPDVVVGSAEPTIEDFALLRDSAPPESEISDPQPGLELTVPRFYVWANATDPNDNGIQSVSLMYSFNSGAFKLWEEDDEAPYVFVFNASEAEGDGVYAFYTLAVDYADNEEVAPATNDTWIVMNAGLRESSVDELDPLQSSNTFTVTATAYAPWGILEVELWYNHDGGDFENYDTDASEPYSWEFTADDGDGTYGFYSIVVESTGERESPPTEPDTVTVVDTTAPSVTVTSPEDAALLSDGSVELAATIEDDGSGLASVWYQVDSGTEVPLDVDEGVSSYDLSETLTLGEGTHVIEVFATDVAGAEGSDEVTVTVDCGPPTVEIQNPEDGSYFGSSTVEVSWTASDSGSGVATVETRIDAGDWSAASGNSETYSDLEEGSHTVDVRAADEAGNSATDSVEFSVDLTPPSLSITAPENNTMIATRSVTVSWEAEDLGSGVDMVEIWDGSSGWTPVSGGSVTLSDLSDGTREVVLRATDNVGNAQTESVIITVDATAPTLTITSPSGGDTIENSSVTVTWTCSDGAGCGIERFEISVDDGAFTSIGLVHSRVIEDLESGEHTVTVRAVDMLGNSGERTVTFTVDLGGGDGGASDYSLLIVVGVLAVVVIAVLAMYMMRRGKAEPPVE